MTPDTVIVCAATETVPVLETVFPAFPAVVLGAFQPAGTTTVTLPSLVPPVAAVYVNVSVLPFEPKPTSEGAPVRVPEPSGA